MSTSTDMLAAYLKAETDLLLGKETRFGDRLLRMEDLAEIRKGRQEWEARVAAEARRASGQRTLGGLSYGVADLSGRCR
ncbi:MAG: hypothetical protein HGA47_02175 [Zoogloea sp.]|nr:hypothetical protein [Zoogloea sp.]